MSKKITKFNIKDKVFYPAHGAGVVKDIKKIDFAGEVKSYYEFAFIDSELTISTPVDNVERLRVRSLNTVRDLEKVIKGIKKIPSIAPPTENYNELMNIMKTKDLSGDINFFVEMIQFCNHVRETRGEDGRLIPSSIVKHTKNASAYLIGELALAKNITYEKSEEEFNKMTGLSLN